MFCKYRTWSIGEPTIVKRSKVKKIKTRALYVGYAERFIRLLERDLKEVSVSPSEWKLIKETIHSHYDTDMKTQVKIGKHKYLTEWDTQAVYEWATGKRNEILPVEIRILGFEELSDNEFLADSLREDLKEDLPRNILSIILKSARGFH